MGNELRVSYRYNDGDGKEFNVDGRIVGVNTSKDEFTILLDNGEIKENVTLNELTIIF